MRKVWVIVGFAVALVTNACAQSGRHVILISIDGFRPDFYLDPSWPTPVMQMLKQKGVYAEKVKSVFPSYTYPSHVAIVTGALPARGGIYYNTPFEPEGSTGKWNWYLKDIKVPTIWSALKSEGLTSGAVEWPVSVGDEITYNVPEIWDTKHPEDRISETRKYATKGLIEEIELNATGKLNGENMSEENMSLDENAGRMAAYIFKAYKPNLLAVHFARVDGAQHDQGRNGDAVRQAIATVDRAIGNLLETVANEKMLDSTSFVITGDHGFMDMQTVLKPNVWLKNAGILGLGKSWKMKFQPSGGSAFLYMQNRGDAQAFNKVKKLLQELPAGIKKLFTIYDRSKLDDMGADSSALLALAAMPGIVFGGGDSGEELVPVKGGHHGYDPNIPQMFTGFIGYGKGLSKGKVIPFMGVEDTAPLIAALLGITFKAPDGILYPGVLSVK